MRVLVIAPDQAGLNTRPEIRQIQRKHHTSIIDGKVTPEDVYQAARETKFDVHHYATHSGPDGVLLSDGVLFDAESVAQIARIHETSCLFFNSCESSKIAAYAVRHGVRYAIHTNIALLDTEAWKAATAFYESLQNGHGKDFVGAYMVADSGDGDYGMSVSPDYIAELQRTTALAAAMPHSALPLSRREAMMWAGALLLASTALATLVNLLAGRF